MTKDVYLYRSEVVAAYIAAKLNEQKIFCNITKIQKLLYVAYGACLFIQNARLTNEHPQAWPYGPVFPTTRNKLSKECLDDINIGETRFDDIKKNKTVNQLIDFVFEGFAKSTASQLTVWSHKPFSPWDYTVRTAGFKWGDRIQDSLIKDYFSKIIKTKGSENNG